MEQKSNSPLDNFYSGRQNFEIVAITGLEGSGCSTLVDAMCKSKEEFLKEVKSPKDIEIDKNLSNCNYNNSELFFEGKDNSLLLGKIVAKRKYTTCYNFFSKNYKPYQRIQYTKVLWLYSLLFWKQTEKESFSKEILLDKIVNLLSDKYCGTKEKNAFDEEYVKYFGNVRDDEIKDIVEKLNIDDLFSEISGLKLNPQKSELDFIELRGNDAEKISDLFFDESSSFSLFYEKISHQLKQKSLYYLSLFYHRLGRIIRTYGDPSIPSGQKDENNDAYSHVFSVVKLINVLIKGLRFGDKPCRIVIDSIRNTIESTWLKERYGAFYLVAVCAEKEYDFLEEKIKQCYVYITSGKSLSIIKKVLIHLAEVESKRKEFEDGYISHPNTSLCVANADIHITNRKDDSVKALKSSFFGNMYEQWMKFASLILHPGLITPSAEERCMSIAYVSSFNSSCISRKVGAVITNKFHSVRTIGWNDVPYGQIPCGLRNLCDVCDIEGCDYSNICYSEFEREYVGDRYSGKSFPDLVKNDYNDKIERFEFETGLPFAYCFRSLDNKFSGEKNQVHTRSLHAEENAMLQMVKYGGEPLKDGVIYVTASPCELCSKKLYQVGIRRIVYIEDYPGIAMKQIIHAGCQQPELKRFEGAFGDSFNKLYRPFLSFKDEIEIGIKHKHKLKTSESLLSEILGNIGVEYKATYGEQEYKDIINKIKGENNEI